MQHSQYDGWQMLMSKSSQNEIHWTVSVKITSTNGKTVKIKHGRWRNLHLMEDHTITRSANTAIQYTLTWWVRDSHAPLRYEEICGHTLLAQLSNKYMKVFNTYILVHLWFLKSWREIKYITLKNYHNNFKILQNNVKSMSKYQKNSTQRKRAA